MLFDRLARPLGTTLSEMFAELERGSDTPDGGWSNIPKVDSQLCWALLRVPEVHPTRGRAMQPATKPRNANPTNLGRVLFLSTRAISHDAWGGWKGRPRETSGHPILVGTPLFTRVRGRSFLRTSP
jgi:hypothetical protein